MSNKSLGRADLILLVTKSSKFKTRQHTTEFPSISAFTDSSKASSNGLLIEKQVINSMFKFVGVKFDDKISRIFFRSGCWK